MEHVLCYRGRDETSSEKREPRKMNGSLGNQARLYGCIQGDFNCQSSSDRILNESCGLAGFKFALFGSTMSVRKASLCPRVFTGTRLAHTTLKKNQCAAK